MFALDIDDEFSPFIGTPIIITEPFVLYRGYDARYDPISSRVTHFGTMKTALGYVRSSSNHQLGCFINTKPLRLFDLRYICVLLQQLFRNRKVSSFDHLEPMARMTLAYGLCSLLDQIGLLQKLLPTADGTKHVLQYYSKNIDNKSWEEMPNNVNPFTPEGIRVGETNNDALTLIFMKEIFGHVIDGFISPKLPSLFHVEKGGYITAEIVLFDPKSIGIQMIQDTLGPHRESIRIEDLLNRQSSCQLIQLRDIHATTIRKMKGGMGLGYTSDTSSFFDRLEKKDKLAVQQTNQMISFAKKINKRIQIIDTTAPHPTESIAPWVK